MADSVIMFMFHVICLSTSYPLWLDFRKFVFYMYSLASIFVDPKYHNDPKFLDRKAWANSADLDQTAPRGAIF